MKDARHRTPTARYMPVSYLAIAIALAAILLPSILRPPQDLQSETTSFSPDAPPDEEPPESILQSIRQASSSTAGSRVTEVAEEVVEAAPAPPPVRLPSRGRCFGDPPRQTESLYSALCVPAWTGGDNGGVTARGVYPDEIRIAVIAGTATTIEEGPLDREFRSDDQETERHLKIWQTYFNERFEFYGRYLQFYVVKMSSQDEDQARAAVTKAVSEYNAFALIGPGIALPTAAGAAEAIRQKLITFIGGNNPVDFYSSAHPYAYSFTMDSWQTRFLGPELACKHFVGEPPGEFNEKMDATFDYNAPRKWGLVLYQDEVRIGARKMYEDRLAKCGGKFEFVQEYNLTDNQQSIAGTMAKMRQAGVTTVVVAVDPLTPPILTSEAGRLEYYPEWIGVTGTSGNGTGRLMNDTQANHYISISSDEIPRPDEDKDWFRAYKEIDPEGDPTSDWFRNLQQLSGGIQHAGTNLTPQMFWNGLKTNPCRTPDPIWSIGGCYNAPDPRSELHYLGDYTYSDYVALQWFDNAGDDPDSSSTGAWCFMYMGKRFRYGELPTDPMPWRDPTQCIFGPPAGVQG